MPLNSLFDGALVSALFLSLPLSLGHQMLALLLSDCSGLLPYLPAFPSGQFCTLPPDQLSSHSHGAVILLEPGIQGLHVETQPSSPLPAWSPLCQHLLQVLDCSLQLPELSDLDLAQPIPFILSLHLPVLVYSESSSGPSSSAALCETVPSECISFY